MPSNPSIVSTANLDQAAGGNAALQQVLQQLINAAKTQATKTNTSGKLPPNQSTATVSYQNPYYTVNFTDPGGVSAASLTQAAQQAAAASLGFNPTQSVIYHQVQAATSILFDAASSLTTYGGDTGSLQNQFIIGDLSTKKQWYFRIRTSYDGQTWNQWRILNNDKATAVNPYSAALTEISGGQVVGITLLGQQVVTFGVGNLPNGGLLESGQGVLLGDTIGIPTPASFGDTGFEAVGTTICSIDGNGKVALAYGDLSGTQSWTGSVNFLTFGYVLNQAQSVSYATTGDGGRWAVLTLPGGARIAIGSGMGLAHGGSFVPPSGFTAANSMGVVSPAVVGMTTHPSYGVSRATVQSGVCVLEYSDSTGHTWGSTGNWFAIAWEASLTGNLVTVSGGQYLRVPTLAGNVMIGVGSTASGGVLPLPAGYTYPKCLAFTTPATFDTSSGNAMHGVQLCTVDAGSSTSEGAVYCLYATVNGPRAGHAAWFSIAWL